MACTIFIVAWGLFAAYHFFKYNIPIINFPYDWEPTDGDHLNIVARVMRGLPIYTDWEKGPLLNIYTPGYHYAVAGLSWFFGLGFPVARYLSFLSFWGIILILFVVIYRSSRGLPVFFRMFVALASACSVFLMSSVGCFFTIVHVSPTTFFIFLGFLSLFLLDIWDETGAWPLLLASGLCASLSFLTKQQGLFAVGSGFIFMLLRRKKVGDLVRYSAAFLVPTCALVGYLEYSSQGNFINSTFIYLSTVIRNDPVLAKQRITQFLLQNWPWFLAFFAGLAAAISKRAVNVWHVSVAVNFVLLCKIVGNGGGGDYYFFPLWLTLVIVSWQFIWELCLQGFGPDARESGSIDLKLILGILMLVAFGRYGRIAVKSAMADFDHYRLVSSSILPVMDRYYAEIKKRLDAGQNRKVFPARTVGAFVAAGADIEYEFCTFAGYAWNSVSPHVNKGYFIDRVRSKSYSMITTGLQAFPSDMEQEIRKYYRVDAVLPVVLYYGRVGEVSIYVPRT